MVRRALLAVLLIVAGCAAPPRNAWTEASLPGDGPRLVRDAVACGGHWYVVGGLGTGPAAWESRDGRTWRSLRPAPLPGSYYGPRNLLYAVACANGRIAALGSSPGGAHGNPRVSTWYQRDDATLAEAPAPFETYGGDTAVDVGRISGGPAGFLITGNRTSGAAAWTSPDGRRFQLFENAPGLAGSRTPARDGVVLDGQFVLVGGTSVWTSPTAATWTRSDVPAGAGYTELQRVTRLGPDLIAVGQSGDTFGAWHNQAFTGWTALGRFGTANQSGARSLTAAGGRLYAVAGGIWRSTDGGRSWLGIIPPRDADTPAAVAAQNNQLLLAAADRVWLAHGV
ncbi:WD40/YVTN/BNR-like repeat-containing protein [Actinoplanes friuliensis]|uniref:Galactose oxidase n=1 Tax=Actinoplanes friuliensis DSM 7358 TaxID=1246995 RepID=U5VTJ2_9ACTN|nr:hypothetical protein [Actinoplanes friuliensis]AGZ38981.1 hypothetical protein AFR_03460 [Actinoplanes friuliensis DSM 7358]